jgi:hypothetical protein
MNFLKNKGSELVRLAIQAGVKIDDECQFAFIPEHVARLLSNQIQRWAATANTYDADSYINEFTPAGDLSTRAEQILFVLDPQQWLLMARGWVITADTTGTNIVDLAELDDLLWCEALRQKFSDDSGVMAGHGFNLAMMLKHAPQRFLAVCQEVAMKYTMRTAERMFDEAVGEWLEELKHGN